MKRREQEILLFIHQKGEARYTDLTNYVEEEKLMTEKTMLKYLHSLLETGKVDKKISDETKGPVYYVPQRYRPEVEKIQTKQNSNKIIDQASPETLELIKNLLRKIRQRDIWLAVIVEKKNAELLAKKIIEYMKKTEFKEKWDHLISFSGVPIGNCQVIGFHGEPKEMVTLGTYLIGLRNALPPFLNNIIIFHSLGKI